jgi:subtilisin family serine protease
MKQKSLTLVLVFVAILWSVQGGYAQSQTPMRLTDGQVVIVELTEDVETSGVEKLGSTNFYQTTMQQVRELQDQGVVRSVHDVKSYSSTISTNDPFETQPYLDLLDAEDLWDITTGSGSTVVAVIDTGFALAHEDLDSKWYENVGEQGVTVSEGAAPNCTSRSLTLDKSCNNLDDDSNGFVDDWRGWDFAQGDNLPNAGSTNPTGAGTYHATAVSGLVSAETNNATGVASLNWVAKIMPLQIFDDAGAATTAELAEALDYAINNWADIINLSLGSNATDLVIESLIDDAEAAGVVIVAAVGNCGDTNYASEGCSYQGQMLYPATNSLTIGVGATNLSDVRASFSSYGNRVDVVAPGSGAMYSTMYDSSDPSGEYSATLYGTSFAAPIVASLAATLKSEWPTATPREIRALLVDTTIRPSSMSGQTYTNEYGFGRIRPYDAVLRAQACAVVTRDEDINCDSVISLVDISLLVSQWQVSRTGRTDINQSGVTDLTDISLLVSKWGS